MKQKLPYQLTERKSQVLNLTIAGNFKSELSKILSINVHTVNVCRKFLLRKL